jgi:2-polyprenyl-6-methoxyphenol hydroxylase-like FAD-dependent oxidoreductase
MAEAARRSFLQTMMREVLVEPGEQPQLRVAVVGGSLGGLAAAAALRIEADVDAHVYERSPRLTGTEGAGLWVQPEFEHYMEANGITTKQTFGVTPERMAFYDGEGKKIFRSRAGGVATSWDTLFRSYRSAVPDECYHAGREVDAEATAAVAAFPGLPRHLALRKLRSTDGTEAAFDEPSEAVTLCFADGGAEQFDAIVFCDGAASRGRKALNAAVGVQEEAISAWAGYWVWRAMLDEEEIASQLPEVWEDIQSEHCWYYLRQAEGRYKDGGPPPPHVADPTLPGTGHFLLYPVPGANGELEPGKRRVMWVRTFLSCQHNSAQLCRSCSPAQLSCAAAAAQLCRSCSPAQLSCAAAAAQLCRSCSQAQLSCAAAAAQLCLA